MKIILASGSPRRAELLGRLGLSFSVCPAEVDESAYAAANPAVLTRRLAIAKARAAAAPGACVIGADTVVYAAGKILGKPAGEADAARMLRLLSGRGHYVFTSVCVRTPQIETAFTERARVAFRPLSDSHIARYIQSGEPMDKAGAYGAQGLGAAFIRRIDGDFYTVMGLPVCRLAQVLETLGL